MDNLHFIKSIVIALISVMFLSWAGNVSAADTQIYPYNSNTGQAWSYQVSTSTCEGTFFCYDGAMKENSDTFYTESDGTQTYKQTGGGGIESSSVGCCEGPNWYELWDNTKNYPSGQFLLAPATTDFAQQRIKIPAGINKITRVKFYRVYSYWQPSIQYGLILYRESTGSTQVGEIYYKTGPSSTGETFGELDFSVNWDVAPGEGYKLRLFTTQKLMALPVSSPCGASGGNCIWWIYSGGVAQVYTIPEKTPHSSVDVYPDGYAEGRPDGSGTDYFAYLRDVGSDKKADIARMAIWGKTTAPNCENLAGPSTITLGNSGTYSADFSSPEGNLSGEINAGQNGTSWLWNPGASSISGNSGSRSFTWTPTATGTYDVFCRAWNDAVAECRGNSAYVDGPPRYTCNGPTSSMTVTISSPAAPPALSTLNVRENNFDDPVGVDVRPNYGKSGLRSLQSGSNQYNSLRIKQNLDTNSSSSNVKLAGVGFAGKGAGAAPTDSSLYALTQSAYTNGGFVLVYADDTVTSSDNICWSNGNWVCQPANFTAGNFYVYYNGNWNNGGGGYLPNATRSIWNTISNTLQVQMLSTPTFTGSSWPEFGVRLLSPLGSRIWGTYGLVVDSNRVSRGVPGSALTPNNTTNPVYGPSP